MSVFKTKQPCPVVGCDAYFFLDSKSRIPNDFQNRLHAHLKEKHPLYLSWLVVIKWNARRKLRKSQKAKKR